MRSLIGILIVALIAIAAYKLYFSHLQQAGTSGSPTQAISAVGVENDLVAIAQAERVYFTEHGSYASLDELISSGALAVKRAREGYTYSVEASGTGFTATARCVSAAGQACTSFAVDQTMQVHPIP